MPGREVIVAATGWLDDRLRSWPRVHVVVGPVHAPAFLFCGVVGYGLAVGASVLLAASSGRSAGTILLMAAAAAVTFFIVAMTTKVLTGEETLTFLNHAIAVILVVSIGLAVTGRPVLPYVDVTGVGLLVFLACGRVGCFLVGCCHGRPHDWGARYGDEHVEEGFPAHLAGVPVVPVPLVEAAADVVIAGVAGAGVLAGWRAGAPVAFAALAYTAIRVLLEQWRGDTRHFALGLSTGQWTSAAGAVAVVVVGIRHPAVVAGAVLVVGVDLVISARSRFGRSLAFRVDEPRHLAELAALLHDLGPSVGTTSAGVWVSKSRNQYACSTPSPLPARAAARLGRRVVQLHHPSSWYRVLQSDAGVIHVLVAPDAEDRGQVLVGAGLLGRLTPEAGRALLAGMQQSHGNASVLQLLAARRSD